MEQIPNNMYTMKVDASTMTDHHCDCQHKHHQRVTKNKPFGYIEPFQVSWNELTYKAPRSFGSFAEPKLILNNINGSFKSGHFTAILGPSGCGKSTLLGCIAGTKKNGVSGNIYINTKRNIKIAFIAQDDYLLERLTIAESIKYASKLKNGGRVEHATIVESVLEKLRITECANLYPKRCSGGQKKRISIALELVSRPNILILDEPTSGLDSVTTKQMVETLIELTQQNEPMAVVATVHQPSGVLFSMFNVVYVLSYDGQCIYNDSPSRLISQLEKYSLKCPEFHNPADFIIEVASKDHGLSKVIMLAAVMRIESIDAPKFKGTPIRIEHKQESWSNLWTLSLRSLKIAIRDPFILPIRFFSHIFFAMLFGILYTKNVGKATGCPEDFATIGGSYEVNYYNETARVNDNLAAIFFMCLMGWFGSIFPLLLTFPLECNVFFKEFQNGWYTVFNYFMAKVIVDIPFQLTIPVLYAVIAYNVTGQFDEKWRIIYFAINVSLVAFSASSQGLMMSALLMKYPTAAVFLGCCTGFLLILFSGFFVKVDSMPDYFQWVSYANYLRFSLESAIATIYGYDRCKPNFNASAIHKSPEWTNIIPEPLVPSFLPQKNFTRNSMISVLGFLSGGGTNDTQSIAMENYNLDDDNLWKGLIMLGILMIIYRIVTYFTLSWKVNREV